MQLAHAGDNCLAGFLVGADTERGVLVGQRLQRLAELVLVHLGLGLDRHVDHGLGEDHALEHDRVGAVAKRVTGGDLLETETSHDVTRKRGVDVLALVRMHEEQPPDALASLLGGVVDFVALADLTRVHTEVGELAERICHDLEGERSERLVLVGLAGQNVVGVRLQTRRCRDVQRARHKRDDCVEHRLHTLVLERRATEHGHERERQSPLADAKDDLVLGELLIVEELLHEVVVFRRNKVEELGAVLIGLQHVVVGDVDDIERLTLVVLVVHDRLHANEVDHATEV
uniref:Unannotated protein n=1 Tax=freshwater metagenome TaxID=449393 RepID=A0A6J7PKK7_9ZZZZ